MSLGLSVRELVTRAREVFASCNAAVPLQLENMTASELVDLIYKTATTAATASAGSISAANKKKPQQKKRQRGGKSTNKQQQLKPSSSLNTTTTTTTTTAAATSVTTSANDHLHHVEIEYVPEALPLSLNDANDEFTGVFEYFARGGNKHLISDDNNDDGEGGVDESNHDKMDLDRNNSDKDTDNDQEEEEEDDDDTNKKKYSAKRKRRMARLTVAELKQLVARPEVVDWVDVCADDPKLLVGLKSTRNTVPIPIHWSQKRKYLQAKRGIIKKPFELPDFIRATGIQEMREAVKEKEDAAKLKSKTRDRTSGKSSGKIDIDYQKLHDAFFRWQTKPVLTGFGEMYYEGKEFEAKVATRKPGDLSLELQAALNIPPLAPPPWLINMQRYGPPPSYPGMKIPGLNAPIPEGAQWGFHPGGWGKPPVDEFNRPLYGDVFGIASSAAAARAHLYPVDPVDRTPWGQLETDDEEEEEEEEEEEDDDGVEGGDGDHQPADSDQQQDESGSGRDIPILDTDGLATPSGFSSAVPSGLETPEFIELRKDQRRMQEQENEEEKTLYRVIPQRDSAVSGFMGSQHVYDLDGNNGGGKRRGGGGGIDVAINPDELGDLDQATLAKKYAESRAAAGLDGGNVVVTKSGAQLVVGQKAAGGDSGDGEDFSDLVAEHAADRQNKKRKKDDVGGGSGSKAKKSKDSFKF